MIKKHFITMRDVFDGVINYLQTQEHPYGTIKPYKTALYRMQKYVGSPEMPYSTELTKQFMEKLSQQLSEGSVSRKTWYSTRRTVVMANEFYETGVITLGNRTVPYVPSIIISKESNILIEQYLQFLKQKNYSDSTIKNNRNDAKLFMHYLETKADIDIKVLDNATAARFIPFVSESKKASVGNTLINVRHFLKFLYDQGLIEQYVPEALHVSISRPKKIHYGFTQQETNAILQSVDTSTAIGKRDYAILMLAAKTGLRSIDIRQLKLSHIKWEQAEIHIVQSKTQKPLILPLMKDVGNAISDYILNARPRIKDKPIFLTSKHPYNGIRYLNDIVKKYACLSCVADTTKASLSIHSFRRGLGVSMLAADVPLSRISEVLGHTKENSTKKYLALNIENLRNCTTPMDMFVPKEGQS